MLRSILTIGLTTLFLSVSGGAFAGQKAAAPEFEDQAPVVLQESIRLDGKIVHLGDLFKNVGDKANIAVAYTPAPGKRTVFDARWLNRIARTHRLKWRPLSRYDRVVVERTSTVINRDQIAEEVLMALLDQGADPDMEVEFSNRMLRLHVAGEDIAVVGVEDSILDPRTNRFSAIIHAPAGDPGAKRIRVTGRVHGTNEVPVPIRRILSGEIIRKDDIKWIKVRSRRLQNDVILNDLDLIGKAPRRGLRSGQPVRTNMVRRPIMVKKGSLVTISLIVPKMTLTAQGKAISDGSEGDIIQITNTQSNTIVDAEVIGTGRVAVRPATQLAMN